MPKANMLTRRYYSPRKRFMEEMILRFEKAFRAVDDSIQQNIETQRALTREIERHTKESAEEWQANRQALFALIDRFEGKSGPSSAA